MSISNPQIQLTYSDDGGFTWSTPRYVDVGKIGGYNQLARAWRLGTGRNRVFRVVYTDATPYALFGADLDISTAQGTT